MADPFKFNATGLTSPGRNAFAVTPNDSTDLTFTARGLYIGGGGDVKLDTAQGDTVTFVGVPAGSVLPVTAARVYSTDTTATSIVAIW